MGELPRVHVITDDAILALPDFLDRAIAVLIALGSHGAVHLRGHATSGRRLYDMVMTLVSHAARAGALLVVNDRLDIAMAAGAGAVQLGVRSIGVEDVRRVAPKLQIGASVHDADSAARSRADWIVAGHVFDTPSHAREAPRGLAFVRQVTERATAPVIAIGGVKPSDVAALRHAGAYGVAVIRGVWHAVDNARAARDYLLELG